MKKKLKLLKYYKKYKKRIKKDSSISNITQLIETVRANEVKFQIQLVITSEKKDFMGYTPE